MSVLDEQFAGLVAGDDSEDERDGSDCRFPDVAARRETEKAYLCSQGGKDCWVPKSQIVKATTVLGVGMLEVTERFAPVLRDKAGWHL